MCTVQSPLRHGKLRLPFFGPIQELRDFSFVLQHTNNHCHPYIDSTTVLSDCTVSKAQLMAIVP